MWQTVAYGVHVAVVPAKDSQALLCITPLTVERAHVLLALYVTPLTRVCWLPQGLTGLWVQLPVKTIWGSSTSREKGMLCCFIARTQTLHSTSGRLMQDAL